MTTKKLKKESKIKAKEIFERFESASQMTPARECSIIAAKMLVVEHRAFTKNKELERFWMLVIDELNNL